MGGLIINYDNRTREEKMAEPMYELDANWCLTADKSTAVPEGHPDARFVLGGPGSRIPWAEAVKYGLASAEPLAEEPAEEPTPEPAPAPAPPVEEPPVEPPVPEAKAKAAKTKTKA